MAPPCPPTPTPIAPNVSPSLAALCVLQAWEQRSAIPGGVAFEPLLRRIVLDHSPASLARIDTFLDALRTAKKPRPGDFLGERANLNLLDLLAFYVGDLVGRALQCAPEWLSQEGGGPGSPAGGSRRFEHSLVCNFPGAAASPGVYAPLEPICARLFTPERSHGVAAGAGALLPAALRASTAPLPRAPGFGYPLHLQEALARCSAQERAALVLAPPVPDTPAAFVAAAPEVLRRGRIAWGAVILADETLARPRSEGGGLGDVVYDPRGRAPAAALDEVAQVLASLQAQPVVEPTLPDFSAWLAGASPGAEGLDVPAAISPYPLKIATTWFAHRHLPGGVLVHRSFPLVTSKAHPGIVLFLPAVLWPAVLLRAWGA